MEILQLVRVEILKFIHLQDQELLQYLAAGNSANNVVDYLVVAGGGGGGGGQYIGGGGGAGGYRDLHSSLAPTQQDHL